MVDLDTIDNYNNVSGYNLKTTVENLRDILENKTGEFWDNHDVTLDFETYGGCPNTIIINDIGSIELMYLLKIAEIDMFSPIEEKFIWVSKV